MGKACSYVQSAQPAPLILAIESSRKTIFPSYQLLLGDPQGQWPLALKSILRKYANFG